MSSYSELNQFEEGLQLLAEPAATNLPIEESVAAVGKDQNDARNAESGNLKIRKAKEVSTTKSSSLEIAAESPPPPGGRRGDGGVWGTDVYCGSSSAAASFACCLLGGCLPASIFCCLPFDKRRVYKVRGIVYDASGHLVGPEDSVPTFKQEEVHEATIDSNRMGNACCISGLIVLFFYMLYFASHN